MVIGSIIIQPGVIKHVDDILVQASTWEMFMERMDTVLREARENGVYISKKKVKYGRRVEYAGFIIIRTDPKLLKSIREFPTQKKAFKGVIGQVQLFNSDTSHGLNNTRELLKNVWTSSCHQRWRMSSIKPGLHLAWSILK